MTEGRKFSMKDFNDDVKDTFIPEGEYLVMMVDDYKKGHVSRGQGAKGDYLMLTFQIMQPNKHQGMKIWGVQSLSEAAWPMLAKLYRAVEPDVHNQVDFDITNDDEVHEALYYKPLVVKARLETHQGKERLRPKDYRPIADDQYDGIMSMAQELLAGGKWGEGPRAPQASDGAGDGASDGAGPEDEECPF